jgi:drug/metabolite transporter (DMT)-like permease
MGPVEIGILLLLALFWGGAFFFIEILVDHLPPLSIVALRVGLGAVLMWVIVAARRVRLPRESSQWGALAVVGVLSTALPFFLITWAQTRIDSGLASVLNATAPLFVVLIAGMTLADERFTFAKLAGVLAGVAGVAILIGPDAVSAGFSGSVTGQLAVVGASLSYASAAIYSRRFAAMGLTPIMVVTGQLTTAAVLLLPAMAATQGLPSLSSLPLEAVLSLLGIVLLSTVLANVLYFRLLERAGATNAALAGFLMPITATVLGVVFLGERLSGAQLLGAGVIAVGLVLIDGRLLGRRAGTTSG